MHQLEQLPELSQDEQKRVDKVIDYSHRGWNSGRDRRRNCARRTQHGDGFGSLLRSAAATWRPRSTFRSLRRRAAARDSREPAASREADAEHIPRIQRESTSPILDTKLAHTDPELMKALHKHNGRTFPPSRFRNLAEELLANRNLLASLAGPTVALTVDVQGGRCSCPHDFRGPDTDPGQPGKKRRRSYVGRRQNSHLPQGKQRRTGK